MSLRHFVEINVIRYFDKGVYFNSQLEFFGKGGVEWFFSVSSPEPLVSLGFRKEMQFWNCTACVLL